MKVQIRGKNVQLTDALKEYVEKKLKKLSKYFENSPEAIVTLLVQKDRHRVEVTIPINGYLLRGEEESGDMYSSVDLVMEKLEKQMERYKTRLAKKIKSTSLKDVAPTMAESHLEDDEPRIKRTKRVPIKPMPVEEAILQMNLIGHSFYVFSNAETEQINVIYRRKDGDIGLIEPEY